MFSMSPSQADVENFIEHLLGRGWLRAKQLVSELNVSRRHLRALAEHSKGRVLSGNSGYRLTAEASLPELEKFSQRMLSQTKRTQARVSATLQVFDDTRKKPSDPY